jgi:hypothetical protein
VLISNSNSNSNSLLICNPTKDCHQQQYNQQTNTKHETIKKTKSSVEEIPVYQHKVQDVHKKKKRKENKIKLPASIYFNP